MPKRAGTIGKHATLALLSHARSQNGPVTVRDAQGNVLETMAKPPTYSSIRLPLPHTGSRLSPEEKASLALWRANKHLFKKSGQ